MKQDIIDKLNKQLTSPTWEALKNSLIGKELIEFAATVVNLSEEQKDSLRRTMYLDTPTISDLNMFCNVHDMVYDLHSPAFIKIEVGLLTKAADPFNAIATAGTTNFYNTDYLEAGDTAVFLQGTLRSFCTSTTLKEDNANYVQLTNFYDLDEGSVYYKLGKNAISSSVRVFKETSTGVLQYVGLYDNLNKGATANIVKIKRGQDHSLNLHFGDGVWGIPFDNTCKYQITWLDGTNAEFDGTLTLNVNGVDVPGERVASDAGKQDDLLYSIAQVKSRVSERSVIATEPQIINAVNQFITVVDCAVPAAVGNVVTVYIKPVNINDTVFDDIVNHLNTFGETVTQWKVIPAEQVRYSITLKAITSIAASVRAAAVTYLTEVLSYLSTPYNAGMSPSMATDLIAPITKGQVIALLTYVEQIQNASGVLALSMRPVRSSVEISQSGTILGWDNDSSLYMAYDNDTVKTAGILKVGDFYIFTDMNTVISYNSNWTMSADHGGYIPMKGVLNALFNGGYMLTQSQGMLSEIEITDLFYNTDFSIQRNPKFFVPVVNYASTLTLDKAIYRKNIGLFTAELDAPTNQYFLYKRTMNSVEKKVPNFSQVLSNPGDVWASHATFGDNLIVFYKNSRAVLVENFLQPESTLDLDVTELTSEMDMNKLVCSSLENSITLVTVDPTPEGYVLKVWRSFGFQITGDTHRTLIPTTPLVCVYTSDALNVNPNPRILQADRQVTIIGTGDKVISVGGNDVVDGQHIKRIIKIGTVDYVGGDLDLGDRALIDVTVSYESADSLAVLDKSKTPILGEIKWK